MSRTRRSAEDDASDWIVALARRVGLRAAPQITIDPPWGSSGSAEAHVTGRVRPIDFEGVFEGPRSTGRVANVRLLLDTPSGKIWRTARPMSSDWETAEADIEAAIDDFEDTYSATGIAGVSVYVRD